jgi:poly(A) polymerase
MQEEVRSTLARAVRNDPLIAVLVEVSRHQGCGLFLVGGWLRDQLLGRSTRDYDFIVEGDAAALARDASHRVRGSFFVMGHETPPNYRIVVQGSTLDMVPQHPEGLLAELNRRDFTINTLTYSFQDERLLDPLDGLKDIDERVVRLVSPEVLESDPLRMLRAVRFCAVLKGFALSNETFAEIRRAPERLSRSAVERIREELDRIIVSERAGPALSLMLSSGLLSVVLSELLALKGLYQGPYHHLDALDHTLQVVRETDDIGALASHFQFEFELSPEDRLVLGYTALFHDIGKAASCTSDPDGRPHFYGHEKGGAETAMAVMRRYAFPNRRAARVKRLIRFHVMGLGLIKVGPTQKALRRIVARLGRDLPLHVLHSLADRRAAKGEGFGDIEKRTVAVGQALLDTFLHEGRRILQPPVLVTGEDVMEILGLAPGPAVGEVLEKLRKLQIDQVISTRDEALSMLYDLMDRSDSPSHE